MEALSQSPNSIGSSSCSGVEEANGYTNNMGLADTPESEHRRDEEPEKEVCPVTLKRKNSQRRLRIPTEDRRLFLSGLNEDILPYINECRLVNNASDENVFPQNRIPVRNTSKCKQYLDQPSTSTLSKLRILQNDNGHAATQTSHFDSHFDYDCDSRDRDRNHKKFLHNNNNYNETTFLDDDGQGDDSVFRSPEPRRKAYNSPKKAADSSNNCSIV